MKFLIPFMLLFFAIRTIAQPGAMMVYDVRNDINMTNQYLLSIESLAEHVNQTKKLTDMWEFYKRTEKMLTKVNTTVNEIVYVQNIIQAQLNAIRLHGYYQAKIKKMDNLEVGALSNYVAYLNSLLAQTEKTFTYAQKLLKDDFFKMNDAERVTELRNVESSIEENTALMKMEYNRLEMKNREAAIKTFINNW